MSGAEGYSRRALIGGGLALAAMPAFAANTAKAVREVKAGRVEFKLDKGGNVAVPVGKFSFAEDQLAENGAAVIEAVVKARPATAKGVFVENVTLSATMLPGLKVDASSFIKN